MAADHVAVVRQAFEIFNAGRVEALVELYHDDSEIVPSGYWHAAGIHYHGHDGVRSYFADVSSGNGRPRIELSDLIAVGGQVLVHGTAVTGEPPLSRSVAWLFCLEDGRIRRAQGFATEEEAIQALHATSDADFRIAFEEAPDVIVLYDDERRFVDANRAASELLGVSREELRGRQIDEFVPPAMLPQLYALLDQLRRDGETSGTFVALASDGTEHPVEFRSRADYVPGRHLSIVRRAGPRELSEDGRLTRREREVLGLLALGFTGAQIAERLVLSPDTVRTHIRNGMEGLGAKTRTQAIAIALQRGDIEL